MFNINRRRFLGFSILLAPAPMLLSRKGLWLAEAEFETDLVLGILAPIYNLSAQHRDLVAGLVEALKTNSPHGVDPALFKSWLARGPKQAPELKTYLVEQFVVRTNYFAVQDGQCRELQLV